MHTKIRGEPMSPSIKHLFVAIPVPSEIKQQLNDWQIQMKQRISFKKWVFPEDYHITLKFLGGVNQDTWLRLKPLISQITAGESTFSLHIEGLGTFGQPSSPRILWTGVKGDLNPLFNLQKNIDVSMDSLGFKAETRSYTPHLTVAKNYAGKAKLDTPYLEQAAQQLPMPLQWEVNEIVLYQTHLGREPMYEAVEVFSFR